MFCKSCGTQIADDARFCSHCGKQQGKVAADDVTTGLTAIARRRSPWTTRFVVIIVALLAAGGAFFFMNRSANETAERIAATNKAIEAVGKLDAALAVGTSFHDYSTRLQDAAAAVGSYEPSDDTGRKVKASLTKAVLYYKAGTEVWNTTINSDWPNKNYPSYWLNAYPNLEISSTGPLPYADELRQIAWRVAENAYREAKSTAATYGK